MSPKLTQAQLDFYAENGYLLLRSNELLSSILPSTLAADQLLPQWADEVRNWPLSESKGKWMPYFEEVPGTGERQIMRTEKFQDYHDGFRGLLQSETLRGVLQELSGERMLLFKDKINYKLPGGNGFEAHLDAPAYDHIGRAGQGGIEHVTANIAIHPATAQNGCLEVVPGSHKGKVDLADGGRIEPEWENKADWLSVPLQPGDVLFFGSHLAHRSGPNKSENPRAMLYATYHGINEGGDLRERYYSHRRKAFPPDHEREVGVDYSEGWKRYAFAAPFSRKNIEVTAT